MRMWCRLLAVFLPLTLNAIAQQWTNPPSAPATAQTPALVPSLPDSLRGQPGSVQSAAMEQVVDRVIEREHALINMLNGRTPFVETYLQNLKFVSHEGPAPAQDHYFLGRIDL